ncbi:MAG: hypothetical protein PHS62_02995 [Patescibacteria group bacterium]|nr:hypothetical protein [Patescibacteria group bacterium]
MCITCGLTAAFLVACGDLFGDSPLTYVQARGNGAENVLDQLFGVELVYRLFNPLDVVHGYTWLYNSCDTTVFSGYAKFVGVSLETNTPTYEIWMNGVPLPSTVQSAEVLALDENGQTANRYPLEVDKCNEPLFYEWMCGAPNGLLVLKSPNGVLCIYRLGDVSVFSSPVLQEKSHWQIAGHHVLDLMPGHTAWIAEAYYLPTALFRVPEKLKTTLDVYGIVQKDSQLLLVRPLAAIITPTDPTLPQWVVNLDQSRPTVDVPFEIGEYRVRFDWTGTGFMEPGNLYTGPMSGGGGGMGVSPSTAEGQTTTAAAEVP